MSQGLPALLALAASGLCAGVSPEETNRRFERAYCAFSLPSAKWQWEDASEIPNAVFLTTNDEEGLILALTVVPNSPELPVDERCAAGYEKGFLLRSVTTEKMDGKLMAFKGTPCYQLRARSVPLGWVTVVRVFAAHGLLYQLHLQGPSEALEGKPDLESVFGGFQFTKAPKAPQRTPPRDPTTSFSESMGRIAFCCVLGVLFLYFLRRKWRRKARPAAPTAN